MGHLVGILLGAVLIPLARPEWSRPEPWLALNHGLAPLPLSPSLPPLPGP